LRCRKSVLADQPFVEHAFDRRIECSGTEDDVARCSTGHFILDRDSIRRSIEEREQNLKL